MTAHNTLWAVFVYKCLEIKVYYEIEVQYICVLIFKRTLKPKRVCQKIIYIN